MTSYLCPGTVHAYFVSSWATGLGSFTSVELPFVDTTVDAQKAIDSFQNTPAAARVFRIVLKKLISFGIPRGYCLQNPIRETEQIKYISNPYSLWPDWAFEIFFEHARAGIHLPVFSAFYTGQRKVDVVPMLRPKQTAEAIELIARKN